MTSEQKIKFDLLIRLEIRNKELNNLNKSDLEIMYLLRKQFVSKPECYKNIG